MPWDVFISHATEDKKLVAEPLANALRESGLSIWYDGFEVRVGDRLRRSIDKGLRDSRYGVVILSKSFFNKHWPQQELDGLAQREASGNKVILPVWYDVNVEDVRRYSPPLADCIAVRWADGLEAVVQEIAAVVKSERVDAINGMIAFSDSTVPPLTIAPQDQDADPVRALAFQVNQGLSLRKKLQNLLNTRDGVKAARVEFKCLCDELLRHSTEINRANLDEVRIAFVRKAHSCTVSAERVVLRLALKSAFVNRGDHVSLSIEVLRNKFVFKDRHPITTKEEIGSREEYGISLNGKAEIIWKRKDVEHSMTTPILAQDCIYKLLHGVGGWPVNKPR